MSAESHKIAGNALFSRGSYNEAIQEYSSAIIKDPTHHVYYTNRALCYMRLKQFERGLDDAFKSSELSPKWVKGHYFAGQCLVFLGRPSEAVGPLKKAYEIALIENVDLAMELVDFIRHTLKAKWELSQALKRSKESDFFQYLTDGIQRDRERQLSLCPKEDWTSIHERYDSKVAALHDLFSRADRGPGSVPIPDAFLGKISFEIMMDPVITPSGITYDRTELLDHIRKIGSFDPLSREPLNVDDLRPNLALKELIDKFVTENGWAIDA